MASSGGRTRGSAAAGASIIASIRSIMAARPLDGILSVPRSPWPSRRPSAKRLLATEQMQDLVLDRAFADQIDNSDGARLVLAPGARDALLELCRIPRQ